MTKEEPLRAEIYIVPPRVISLYKDVIFVKVVLVKEEEKKKSTISKIPGKKNTRKKKKNAINKN
jgi:hypothetical protein